LVIIAWELTYRKYFVSLGTDIIGEDICVFDLLNEILVTQILVYMWAEEDDEALQEFYVYCALASVSMFTEEDKLELERRQASTPSEASDQDYKAGWVWEGDPFTGDWVWSETGEWPEWPPGPTQTTQEDQETEEDPDIAEFLQIWTGV